MSKGKGEKMFNNSRNKLAKEIALILSKSDEKQALLIKAKEVFDELEKNFDKEQISGILEVIKVLNELFGF